MVVDIAGYGPAFPIASRKRHVPRLVGATSLSPCTRQPPDVTLQDFTPREGVVTIDCNLNDRVVLKVVVFTWNPGRAETEVADADCTPSALTECTLYVYSLPLRNPAIRHEVETVSHETAPNADFTTYDCAPATGAQRRFTAPLAAV